MSETPELHLTAEQRALLEDLVTSAERQLMCRCGHAQNDHKSAVEQQCGEKVLIQKCGHCACESFVWTNGQLGRLFAKFQRDGGTT